MIQMAQTYTEALWKAIKTETETESLVCQTQGVKDIIDEAGAGFFQSADQINELAKMALDLVTESDKRIEENNTMLKQTEEEEEEADEDDERLVKEENKGEYEL